MTTRLPNTGDKIRKSLERFDNQEWSSYFKYFSDDPDVLDGIFNKQRIRFTQPRALNDPLEFNPTIHFREEQLNRKNYSLNGLRFGSVESFSRVQLLESQINAYGILSLTKKPNSFNMWSQYANGHRGFVIEFKPDFNSHRCMLSSSGEIHPVRKVNYVDDYSIRIEELADKDGFIPMQTVAELFFKKTSRWKHEDEYRMVRPLSECPYRQPPKKNYAYTDPEIYVFPFEIESISAIILGASMPKTTRATLFDFSEKHNIVLQQATVIRDLNDSDGQRGGILFLDVDRDNWRGMLDIEPQILCTDTLCLEERDTVEIQSLRQLPYYQGYESIVEEFYNNARRKQEYGSPPSSSQPGSP